MELIDALERTFQHAHGVIGNVRADQYDDPTPCPEWVVRDLLGHTIGVVAGLGAAASGAPPTEFVLGPDPAAQFHQAAESALAAWRTPGVFDRIVDGGAGPMPGRVRARRNHEQVPQDLRDRNRRDRTDRTTGGRTSPTRTTRISSRRDRRHPR